MHTSKYEAVNFYRPSFSQTSSLLSRLRRPEGGRAGLRAAAPFGLTLPALTRRVAKTPIAVG